MKAISLIGSTAEQVVVVCPGASTYLIADLNRKLLSRGTELEEGVEEPNSFETTAMTTCFMVDQFTLAGSESFSFWPCSRVNRACC